MERTPPSPTRAATAPAAGSPTRLSPKKPSIKDITSTVPDVPLDFSFMNLPAIMDILKEEPVSGRKKAENADVAVVPVPQPSDGTAGTPHTPFEPPVSIRLNNNFLTHIDDLDKALSAVFVKPSRLQWIDLSGNSIATIPVIAFQPYLELTTVHLHANQLCKYTDIDGLAVLTKLRHLTLHGNPVEEKKHYRNYTIHHIPSLLELDFSCVTKLDREKAETWSITYRKKLARRRGEEVDD
ncbi:hypothetical protein H310_08308 [Aphanomyces invadans]|uniref:Leucine-rich repeat-containing protein 51 n=1 Tax=Aphanomyces invadans TaxID=157072 RepID=A0A024TXS6_9STRA|nr:hypothetical protein H310_08308 [Aphanomyces invadans]ETV98799.1 hypothetical protein H310_08308 [Aphanomyces invadans]|eukprot:XP_008872227.1 hypothetical protein H310_08308 [Aphanomyces invadans]